MRHVFKPGPALGCHPGVFPQTVSCCVQGSGNESDYQSVGDIFCQNSCKHAYKHKGMFSSVCCCSLVLSQLTETTLLNSSYPEFYKETGNTTVVLFLCDWNTHTVNQKMHWGRCLRVRASMLGELMRIGENEQWSEMDQSDGLLSSAF